MAKPGPAPKPTKLKLLDGNRGHQAKNRAEPQPSLGRPTCPSWMAPEAKNEWHRVVPDLERVGILAVIDRAQLAAYCQSWAWYVAAEKVLAAEGLTYMTPWGQMCARPEVAVARNALVQLKGFAAEFGLAPASRTRIRAPTGHDETDPMEAFLD